jgi:ABC-type uncharacterized transport system ATPase subunit
MVTTMEILLEMRNITKKFMLIPALSVVENIILGMRQGTKGVLNLRRAADAIIQLSEKYGLNIKPFAKVSQLSVGEQQRVEIVKAIYRGADLLILDEPTAVLTSGETSKKLF